MKEEYFEHFGVRLSSIKVKKYLNRENFAVIDTNCGNDKYIRYRLDHWNDFMKMKDNIDISKRPIYLWPPSYKYCLENGTLRLSDEFCKKYKEACLNVYDANMYYFKKIDNKEFNEKINNLLKKYPDYVEVKNLNDFRGKSGIYIMVLDEYKQVYIGQSKDIYQRITRHWKTNPPFDRLIFPNTEQSNIHIDSFGALDTTRIYVKEIHMKNMYSLDREEEKIVKEIPSEYKANRVCGGLRLNTISDFIKGANSINCRNFKK